MTLGTILAAAFQVMRRNPRPTFGLSLLLNASFYLLFGIVIAAFAFFAIGRISSASVDDQDSIIAGAVLGGGLTLLIPLVGSIAVTAIIQGIVSLEVARGTVGEKLRASGLFARARGRIGALVGWSLLVALVVTVVIVVATLVSGLLIAFGGLAGAVIGVLLALAFGAALVVLSVWIGTKLSLVPSVLMLERLPLRSAIARSWALTTRSFWKTFGTETLVVVIIQVASQVLTVPISFIFGIVLAIIAPNGQNADGSIRALVVLYIITGVVSLLLGAVGVVMQSATAALIYIDLRMRREGLDLELMRFVEARQAGATDVRDPYLETPAGAQPPPDPGSPWA
jgi:hypothetical protein